MKTELKVRVIKPRGPLALRRKGDVLTPTPAVAGIWIKRGWVEPVDEELPFETATVEPERNMALRTERPKRKRGRPRIHPVKA
jgi:hypothetical protein